MKEHIYFFKKITDFSILPTNNQICAIKEVFFRIAYQTVGIGELPDGLPGAQVNLVSVLAWSIREMRLHQVDGTGNDRTLHFNLKLNGRPFWCRYDTMTMVVYQACRNI